MNCYHCNGELIWGGDHDIDDSEDYCMITNLTCPTCKTYHEVFLPKDKEFFKKFIDNDGD